MRASISFSVLLCAGLLVSGVVRAASDPPFGETPAAPPEEVAEPAADPDLEVGSADADRTQLNLLGEVDASSGESRRNENVQLTLLDNNVLKEMNIRMGVTATIIEEFQADKKYFGKEFGGAPDRQIHLPALTAAGFHGSLYETHQNSLFQARSFFQVGGVQPARSNDYGFRVGMPIWSGAHFTVDASQQRNTGNVNGNVLVPTLDERTPLTTDPERREIVQSILDSYPAEAPNRTDINPRALNTNAPQKIDNDAIGGRLDQRIGDESNLFFDYRFKLQNVDAFQLVEGQNPDTTTRSHDAKITWNRVFSPSTVFDASVAFNRVTSAIALDADALGAFMFFGRQIESLGGSSSLPIDRATNAYRYAGLLRTTRNRHELTFGFMVERDQLNGLESARHKGLWSFNANFGRSAIDNIRYGTPSHISQTFGNSHRGFRRWNMHYFIGDRWNPTADLTLTLGLRYEPSTRPIEVNGLSELPYSCDCNNFAPSFGFAYRTKGMGVLRGAYGLHYGRIFAATYTQARFNPPSNIRLSIQAPDILDPFSGVDVANLDPNSRSSITEVSPDLVAPYSHQYNFSWEFGSRIWSASLGYVGSRSHRLLVGWPFNRAVQRAGEAPTLATVNERRPDRRFFDVVRVLNGSRGYYDAARADFSLRPGGGLFVDFGYWFSKAIDLGGHYASNAGTRDAFAGRGQSELGVHEDIKALSNFDQPHAAQLSVSFETPTVGGRSSVWNRMLGRWQFFSVYLIKTGTPFIVRSGSDGPGFGNVDGVVGDRPHIVDPSILGRSIDHPDTSQERLPRSAFAFMQPGEKRGNLARNAFRKDGIRNLNASLSRDWPLGGDRRLRFTAESINALNSPQFAEPGTELTGANFGVITNTLNDGRTFRFTLRLTF